MLDVLADDLEAARKLFAGTCTFVAGADSLGILPPARLPEVAFAGRSNVGKSSLLNALTGRKALARTSNTPGRTQQLNFFDVGGVLCLVDMPGYGFAEVSKTLRASWVSLIGGYLGGRASLRSVFILVDSRHGLKESDHALLSLCDESGVAARVVLTKTDKASQAERERIESDLTQILKKHPAAFPHSLATSAKNGTGIAELRVVIHGLASQSPQQS